jgi:hypothetical protein
MTALDYVSHVPNINDNSKSRMVAFRLPNDMAEILDARRLPGQPFAYVLVSALREALYQRRIAPPVVPMQSVTPLHEKVELSGSVAPNFRTLKQKRRSK